MAGSPTWLEFGSTPTQTDSEWTILQRMLGGIGAGGGGGGGGTNNLSGAGSPVGVVTPGYVGQFYTDTNSPHAVWTATGPTSADWVEVAGNLT